MMLEIQVMTRDMYKINQSITHNLPVIGTDIHPTMYHYNCSRGRRDRMVVGCTTT